MDKITFRKIGVNNIDKYIGKEGIVDGKKFIIIGYTTDHHLFILAAVNPEDGIWNDDHAKNDGLVFLIKLILFLRKCLKELLIHIQKLYSCNVVLYDCRYL